MVSANSFMQPASVNAASANSVGRGRRGRGRPPKNTNLTVSTAGPSALVTDSITNEATSKEAAESANQQYEDCHVEKSEIKSNKIAAAASSTTTQASEIPKVSQANNASSGAPLSANAIQTSKTSTKLIKSLINKSSSNSNLQKSKVLNTASTSETPAATAAKTSNKVITKSESSSNIPQNKPIVIFVVSNLSRFNVTLKVI